MLSTIDPPQNKIYTQKESKDMEKKAGEVILTYDKTAFRLQVRDQEKNEIISSVFSNHNSMILESNHKKNTKKHSKTWWLNNMLTHNEWVNNEKKQKSIESLKQ